MIAFLTSSPCVLRVKNGRRTSVRVNEANGFVEALKNEWKDKAKCLMISSDPDAFGMNDGMKKEFTELFPACGLKIKEFDICDSRDQTGVDRIDGYDVVFLSGGHVPTQNRFFREINLRERISDFDGILIGISAGTMNCAEEVYAQPELEGESRDPEYQRFIRGLGITDLTILPHYQAIKDEVLDGKRIMEDITYPDSMGKRFYALADGSYFLLKNGKTTLCGESYLIGNGAVKQICGDGQKVDF